LTEVDKGNAEDILIIAVEMLNEVKEFDPTVMNPINF